MTFKPIFIVARTQSGRPTLQHRVDTSTGARALEVGFTACGLDFRQWSRAVQNEPIREVLCLKCGKLS